jgi:tripartite-type tricarboxylate transporter receptor subunit TctC
MKRIAFLLSVMVLVCPLVLFAGGAADNPAGGTNWPSKTVTLTLPFSAGGDTDTYGRFTAHRLSEYFGKNFIVVNMTGANGVVCAEHVRAQKPDGYNLMFAHTQTLIQEAMGIVKFSYINDMDVMATVCIDRTYALVALKESGWKNLADLIKAAKERPGQITLSQVWGGQIDILYRMLSASTGISLKELDIGGSAADRTAAFLGKQCDLLVANTVVIRDYLEKGDFIPLAIASEKRLKNLPNAPTFIEQGAQVLTDKKYEFTAPKGIDKAIVDKLNEALAKITKESAFIATLDKYNAEPFYRDAATSKAQDIEELAVMRKFLQK